MHGMYVRATTRAIINPVKTSNLVRATFDFSPNPCVGPNFGSESLFSGPEDLHSAPLPMLGSTHVFGEKSNFASIKFWF